MNQKKYLIIAFSILSFVFVTCVENHVLPNFGSITITSDPIGVEVFLDNESKGVTNLEINEIVSGSYSISLKKTEFKDSVFTVDIDESQELSFDIFMKESNPKGKITITSEPSGATIFINNISSGKKTPSTFSNLERGNYDFSLRLNLYENSNFEIDLGRNQTVNKNTKLSIASTAGVLFIRSTPVGAAIYIDDNNTGKVTPDTIKPIVPGEHAVKLLLANYKDTTFTTNISTGGVTNENISLKAIFIINATVNPINSGTITGANSYVQGATAELTAIPSVGYNFVNWTENNNEVSDNITYSFVVTGSRNLVANFELKQYQISASTNLTNAGIISGTGNYKHGDEVNLSIIINTGYDFLNWSEDGNQVSTSANYKFTAIGSRTLVANFIQIGNLEVTSNPIGANIFIDNENTNKVTPFTFQDIEIGDYQITLKKEDYADTTLSANIVTGKTTILSTVYMRDITPDVEVDISYIVQPNQSLLFTFVYNQDVNFDQVVVTIPPNTQLPPQNYGGALIPEGVGITWTYPEKIVGDWEFTFYGNKVDGRKFSFTVNENKIVE